MKYSKNRKGAFLVDLILLPLFFGPLIVFLTVRFFYRLLGMKKWIIPSLFIITLIGFWLTSGGAYFDFLPRYPLFSPFDNDYMWNFPLNLLGIKLVKDIPTYKNFFNFWNILALVIFIIVYPIVLYLGIQIGYLSYGRSPKQKGTIDLLFKGSSNSKFR